MIKLFIMSAMAVKSETDSQGRVKIETIHGPGIVTAETSERAKEICMEAILKKWPEAEGWRGHAIGAVDVDNETIGKIALAWQGGAFDEDGEGVSDLPELIM
jgi:hypothetical protein